MRRSKCNSQFSATMGGVLAIVLWSTTIAFSRSIAEQLGTFTGAAVVYLAAGLLGCGRWQPADD